MANLIKMVRGSEWPEPHSADVHPDEVENYRVGGFEPANPKAEKAAENAAPKPDADDLPALSAFRKDELIAVAADEGVAITKGMTVADIREAIEKARG